MIENFFEEKQKFSKRIFQQLLRVHLIVISLLIASTAQSANLREVFEKSIKMNPDVSSQNAIIEQKEYISGQVKSKMLPSLEVSAFVLRQTEPQGGLVSSFSPADQVTTKATINQSISALYTEMSNLKAKKFESLAQAEQYNKTLEDLYLSVAEYYFNILSTESDLRTYEEEIQVNYKRLADLRRQASGSRARKTDLYITQAQVFALESQKENTIAVLKAYRSGLFLLSGIDESERLEQDMNFDQNPKPLAFYLENVNATPKVRQSKYQLEAAVADLKFSKNDYIPKINLGANYYFQRPGINSDINWDVGLTISMPIYSGGETTSKIGALRAAEMSKIALVKREQIQAQDSISSIYETYVGTTRQFLNLKKAIDSSTNAMQASRQDFGAGLINNSEYQRVLADHFSYLRNFERVKHTAALLLLKLNIFSQKVETPFKKISSEATDGH